jgi:hypothetical protein
MTIAAKLVTPRQRHLKWRALDGLELVLMVLCGVLLFSFCTYGYVRYRHPYDRCPLALAAGGHLDAVHLCDLFRHRGCDSPQRSSYLTAIAEALEGRARLVVEIIIRLVVLGVAISFIYFGYLNFLRGFSSFRMPSMTPIASLYAAIPICGVLVALFTLEQIVNGLKNGFDHKEPEIMPINVADSAGRRE